MAVVKRFRSEALAFPRRVRRGIGKGDLLWGTLDHSRVLQILHNPLYAGPLFKDVPALAAMPTSEDLISARGTSCRGLPENL
jgi:hypothetical protein